MSQTQGVTVRGAAGALRAASWDVAYLCVPNRPYIGVVAIPVPEGAGRRRYPDVVAGRDDAVALVEVEPRLTRDIAHRVGRRLDEQRAALLDPVSYSEWRSTVYRRTGVLLAPVPRIELHLVIGQDLAARHSELVAQLSASGVATSDLQGFSAAVAL